MGHEHQKLHSFSGNELNAGEYAFRRILYRPVTFVSTSQPLIARDNDVM